MRNIIMTKIIKIILVDDHSLVRAGIREFLSKASHIQVVAEAGNGVEAQELIQQHEPDMVLVDIELPDINGIDLAFWIRKHFAQMKIIILSSYDDDDYVMSALKAGANGYSLKNTSPAKLIESVNAVYANQSSLDPAIATKVMNFATGTNVTAQQDQLSSRELEVLTLAAQGKTNKEIGETLFISGRTVQGHLSKIFTKLNVETRTEAVVKCAANGLIKIDCGSMTPPGHSPMHAVATYS